MPGSSSGVSSRRHSHTPDASAVALGATRDRRHSTSSSSDASGSLPDSSGPSARQYSNENIEYLPARLAKVTTSKPAANPLQFVKVGPCDLYRSAQEQIRKVEQVKKMKAEVRDEAEDWQSNLDNWKSSRRKRQEHIIERVVEVKKLELEEHDRSRRKSKTFSEILEERRGRKLSLPMYQEEDSHDLSDLGISAGSDRSCCSRNGSRNGDADGDLDTDAEIASDAGDARSVDLDANHDVQTTAQNGHSGSSGAGSPEPSPNGGSAEPAQEYTYERAIQSYVDFAETRVRQNGHTSPASGAIATSLGTKRAPPPPPPAKPRRDSAPDGVSVAQRPALPNVDVGKRRELFEKAAESSRPQQQHLSRNGPSGVTSVRDRLNTLERQADANADVPASPSSVAASTNATAPAPPLKPKPGLVASATSACRDPDFQTKKRSNFETCSSPPRSPSPKAPVTAAASTPACAVPSSRRAQLHRSLDSLDVVPGAAACTAADLLSEAFERVQSLQADEPVDEAEPVPAADADPVACDGDVEDAVAAAAVAAGVGVCVCEALDGADVSEETATTVGSEIPPHVDSSTSPSSPLCDSPTTTAPSSPEMSPEHYPTDVTSALSSDAQPEVHLVTESSFGLSEEIRSSSLTQPPVHGAAVSEPALVPRTVETVVFTTAGITVAPPKTSEAETETGNSVAPSTTSSSESSSSEVEQATAISAVTSISSADAMSPLLASANDALNIPPLSLTSDLEIIGSLSFPLGPPSSAEPPKEKPPPPPTESDEEDSLAAAACPHFYNSQNASYRSFSCRSISCQSVSCQSVSCQSVSLRSVSCQSITCETCGGQTTTRWQNASWRSITHRNHGFQRQSCSILTPLLAVGCFFPNGSSKTSSHFFFQRPHPRPRLSPWSESPLRRLDSTKRIKKEIRRKRSDFLGIAGPGDDMDVEEPTLSLAPPPDMAALLAEERRVQQQLFRRSLASASESDAADAAESRDSGVELERGALEDTASPEPHSRTNSEIFGHHSFTSEEDDSRRDTDMLVSLDEDWRHNDVIGEQLAERLRVLEMEKVEMERRRIEEEGIRRREERRLAAREEALRHHEEALRREQARLDAQRMELESPILTPPVTSTNQRWSAGPTLQTYATRQAEPLTIAGPARRPPPPAPPAKPQRMSSQEQRERDNSIRSSRVPSADCLAIESNRGAITGQLPIQVQQSSAQPHQMSRQTLQALSAAPRSRLITNDTWIQARRKQEQPSRPALNTQHWLIQEAEHRRLTEQAQRCAPPPRRPPPPQQWAHHQPPPPPPPPRPEAKPLPDAIIQTLTQRVQGRAVGLAEKKKATGVNLSPNREQSVPLKQFPASNSPANNLPPPTVNGDSQEKMLSVSGKKKCSHCGEELVRHISRPFHPTILGPHKNTRSYRPLSGCPLRNPRSYRPLSECFLGPQHILRSPLIRTRTDMAVALP